jgi:hypothetical protein
LEYGREKKSPALKRFYVGILSKHSAKCDDRSRTVQKLYWSPRLSRDKEVEETADITTEAPH